MQQFQQDQLVFDALKGHEAAIEFFNTLAFASQIIDDYWDGDKPVAKDDLLRVILALAVDLPRNAFYRLLPDEAVRLIEDALCFWLQANDIEQTAAAEKRHARRLLQVSYITRSVLTDVLIKLARLVGGRTSALLPCACGRKSIWITNLLQLMCASILESDDVWWWRKKSGSRPV